MKIFYITMFFPAPTEPFAAGDVRALTETGVEVSVHSLRRPFPGSRELLEERRLEHLSVTHGGWRSFLKGLLISFIHPLIFLQLFLWLVRVSNRRPSHFLKGLVLMPRAMEVFALILREKPDVVHLFWGHYPSLVGFLVRRFLPRTVLSIFLGAYDLWTGFGGSADVAKNAPVVWTHAGCNVPAILAWGVDGGKIRVCHRGVDLSPAGASKQEKVRRRIVTAGRLKQTKGMDRVLRMFGMTISRWPDATLVILGTGPEENNLRALAVELGIEKSVVFGGHVPHEEVFREMDAAEVFVLMTRHVAERLPNVVKEAMACRCLCLVSSTPGIEELVADGETGFVLDLDEEVFAGRLNEVFAHPERYTAMVDAAEVFVRENFDARLQMGKYRQIWEELVSRTASA
jgi:colanic acid/amylovoran biosynthesis glycosyltransferase